MAGNDDEIKERPFHPELVALLQSGLRAKLRFVAIMLGLATFTFVWFAKDAGVPLWLVALIGFFGALLIGLFVALIWFWLFFLDHFRKAGAKNPSLSTIPPHQGEGGPSEAEDRVGRRNRLSEPGLATPIPNPSPQGGREPDPSDRP